MHIKYEESALSYEDELRCILGRRGRAYIKCDLGLLVVIQSFNGIGIVAVEISELTVFTPVQKPEYTTLGDFINLLMCAPCVILGVR